MGRKTIIVIWLVALAPVPFHLAEVQQSKELAHIGLLEKGSRSLVAPLTDAFVSTILSAVPTYAQEQSFGNCTKSRADANSQNFVERHRYVWRLRRNGASGRRPISCGDFFAWQEISDRLNLNHLTGLNLPKPDCLEFTSDCEDIDITARSPPGVCPDL